MKIQMGFSLIERAIVIAVMGLLAAAAVPKVINETNNPRVASVKGVASDLRAAVTLARSQYVSNGVNTASSVTMDASSVTVLTESANPGLGGRPTADIMGISIAMPDPDGFAVPTYSAGVATYFPTGYATTSQNCYVAYTAAAAGDPVIAETSGC